MTDVSSALTQALQPEPYGSRCGGETRTWRGYDAAVNTESSCSWISRPTSGGGSGGGGSLAPARMNSGTGERLSAMPQPASAITAPTINNLPQHPPILSRRGPALG